MELQNVATYKSSVFKVTHQAYSIGGHYFEFKCERTGGHNQ